ncbi:MAG: flagellar filament capping protein FliD [Lachnospiraceae bacterium]|nr:flagellar filament capping protein FliD [Lachnospiraceae bacterium]
MPMRMSGLISGLDTDTVISQLVSARKMKVTKAKGDQTKLSWKQDIWKDLNKDLVSLRTLSSNMRWSTSWAKKTTSVSDTSKASVITGSGAVDSVQSLKITQLAKSGYLTGAQINLDAEGKPNGQKYTALTKMSDLGFSGEATINIGTNGSSASLTVNADSTISDVLSALKKQGLNASFDENNQRFFISSKTTGAASDFSITASDASGQDLLNKLGISTYDRTAQEALKAYTKYDSSDGTAAAEALKRAQAAAESYKSLYNSKIAADKSVTDIQKQIDELGEDATDEERQALTDKLAEATAKAADLQAQVDTARGNAVWNFNEDDITYGEDGSITSITNVTATDSLVDTVDAEYLARKEYAQSQLGAIEAGTLKGAASKVTGQDAKIELNGAEFSSSTNVFEVNGLTITALAETKGDEEITLTTNNDTSGIYNMVKDFLKTYNKIINQLDKLYNADSASKFSPLTDEEKEALSDTEVEKYEQKIKDSLLRGDTTISSITSALTGIMSGGVEIDGKKRYLSDFGINTLGYFESEKNESHAYHIDGDSDDEKTSGKTDVLKGLIASDPDTVTKFFSKLSQDLYSRLDKLSSRMAGRRTYGSFFEDQTLKNDVKSYDSKISDLEEAANKYEDNLYRKFSKMEAAMAKLQSKTSALGGLFGGSQ